jgi:Global regulator protein family
MLVVTRRTGERIMIGSDVRLTIACTKACDEFASLPALRSDRLRAVAHDTGSARGKMRNLEPRPNQRGAVLHRP